MKTTTQQQAQPATTTQAQPATTTTYYCPSCELDCPYYTSGGECTMGAEGYDPMYECDVYAYYNYYEDDPDNLDYAVRYTTADPNDEDPHLIFTSSLSESLDILRTANGALDPTTRTTPLITGFTILHDEDADTNPSGCDEGYVPIIEYEPSTPGSCNSPATLTMSVKAFVELTGVEVIGYEG